MIGSQGGAVTHQTATHFPCEGNTPMAQKEIPDGDQILPSLREGWLYRKHAPEARTPGEGPGPWEAATGSRARRSCTCT